MKEFGSKTFTEVLNDKTEDSKVDRSVVKMMLPKKPFTLQSKFKHY